MQYLWIEIPRLRNVISGSYNSYLAMRPAVFPPTMQMNITKVPPLENSSKFPEHLPSPEACINDPKTHNNHFRVGEAGCGREERWRGDTEKGELGF